MSDWRRRSVSYPLLLGVALACLVSSPPVNAQRGAAPPAAKEGPWFGLTLPPQSGKQPDVIVGDRPARPVVLPPGEISLSLKDDGAIVRIVVEDNGKGLPVEGRERLTEPYMTTRSKGTGLGLAIVKKIMEDHGGHLTLEDSEAGGARISLVFRRDAKEIASARPQVTAAQ